MGLRPWLLIAGLRPPYVGRPVAFHWTRGEGISLEVDWMSPARGGGLLARERDGHSLTVVVPRGAS